MLRRINRQAATMAASEKLNVTEQMFNEWSRAMRMSYKNNDAGRAMLQDTLWDISKASGCSDNVAFTLLMKSKKYPEVFCSDKQIWKLTFIAAEHGIAPIKLAIEDDEVIVKDSEKGVPGSAFNDPDIELNVETYMEEENDDYDCSDEEEPKQESVQEPAWTPDPNGVRLGDKVSLVNTETSEVTTYQICSKGDLSAGRININAKFAGSLLGHIENDTVTIDVPKGSLEYKIISISRF